MGGYDEQELVVLRCAGAVTSSVARNACIAAQRLKLNGETRAEAQLGVGVALFERNNGVFRIDLPNKKLKYEMT